MKKLLLTVSIIIFSGSLYSQPQEIVSKSIDAIPINSKEIVLDGKLDEPLWNNNNQNSI